MLGIEEGPVFLMIVKPTMNTEERIIVSAKDFKNPRIHEAFFFLININVTELHDCDHNDNNLSSLMRSLK